MSFRPEQPVWLVGLPGAGKTTVGRLLADRLRRGFIDLDERIVAMAGADIPSIFGREGEAGFRRREAKALAACAGAGRAPQVVALGGGIVCRQVNRATLARSGVVLWLDVSLETARRRCAADRDVRPLIAILDRHHRRRSRRLEQYAALGVRIDAGGAVADVVRSALAALAAWGLQPPSS